MTKNDASNAGAKMQWKAPELIELGMDMNDVKSALAAGTDALQFGSSTSQS